MTKTNPPGGSSAEPDLAALREDIDALDTQIHDLLMQRFAITGQVAAAKGAQADPSLIPRPARERAIVERLSARHRGAMPIGSLVRIWKEIMGAACDQQGDFRIGVVADPVSSLALAAREHFGTAVKLEFGAFEAQVAALQAHQLALLLIDGQRSVPEGLFPAGEVAGGGILLSVHRLEV